MYQEVPFDPRAFSGSIADLILRPADARAAAIKQAADAMAQAKQQSGQAYGQAIAGAGQQIGAGIQQLNNPERQLAQQQVEANKRSLAYGTAVNGILSKAKGADGKYDHDFLTQQMASANIPESMQADVLKTVDSLEEHGNKMQAARREGQADVGHLIYQTLKALPKDADPQTVHGAILHAAALAKGSGVSDDQEISEVLGAIDNGTPPMGVALGLMGQSPTKRYDDILKPLVIPRPGASVQDASGNVSTPVALPPPPPTEAGLAALAHPGDPAGALAAMRASATPVQPEVVQTDKGPQLVDRSAGTAKPILDTAGNPLHAPIPASIQVNAAAQSAVQNLPEWATDDSRPVGADANKVDPTVRMTPNGLYQAALNYISTGQYPQTGRGSDPTAQAVRAAINAKVGAIAAASGMDEPALRAFFKANTASLTQQQKQFDAAQANIATADRNVAELQKYLDKLPDTGSPLFNQPLRAFAKNVQGDPNMGPIATYLASVQNEYGKLINSANGASAVLTDSARHEAQTLLNDNATVAQMIGSIKALQTEGGNRLLSTGDQIKRIQDRMKVPSAGAAAPIKVGGFTVTVKP